MSDKITTKFFGEEEDPPMTTHAEGEEEYTTDAIGEEDDGYPETSFSSPFGGF